MPSSQVTVILPKDVHEGDIVIALIGLTGSGKSHFIETLTNKPALANAGLTQISQDLCAYKVSQSGRPDTILIDTPGFDADKGPDAEILGRIIRWLAETPCTTKLTGIAYLVRISDNRFSEKPIMNLSIYNQLCGDNAPYVIVFVTTMWDLTNPPARAETREKELKDKLLKSMISLGSSLERFHNTPQSAQQILEKVNAKKKERESVASQVPSPGQKKWYQRFGR